MSEADRGTRDEQLHDTKRGVAILVTCLVETLKDTDPTFQDRFIENLDRAYRITREQFDDQTLDRHELIRWVQTTITGWSSITGQGKPFFES